MPDYVTPNDVAQMAAGEQTPDNMQEEWSEGENLPRLPRRESEVVLCCCWASSLFSCVFVATFWLHLVHFRAFFCPFVPLKHLP